METQINIETLLTEKEHELNQFSLPQQFDNVMWTAMVSYFETLVENNTIEVVFKQTIEMNLDEVPEEKFGQTVKDLEFYLIKTLGRGEFNRKDKVNNDFTFVSFPGSLIP